MPDNEQKTSSLQDTVIKSIEIPGDPAEASQTSESKSVTPQTRQSQEQQQQQNLAEVMGPLMPLAKQYVESQSRQVEFNHKIEEKRVELEREEQRFRYNQFTKSYWLVVFISVSIVAISVGITFYLEEPDKELLVLSHVGSIVAGILAGTGWERSQRSNKNVANASGGEKRYNPTLLPAAS